MKSFLTVFGVFVLLFAAFPATATAQSLNNTSFITTVVSFNAIGRYYQEFKDIYTFRDGSFGTFIMDKSPKWIQQRTFSEKEVCLPPGCVAGNSTNYSWTADLIRTECEPDCIWRFTGNRIGPIVIGTVASSLGDNFIFIGFITDPSSPPATQEITGDVSNYGDTKTNSN